MAAISGTYVITNPYKSVGVRVQPPVQRYYNKLHFRRFSAHKLYNVFYVPVIQSCVHFVQDEERGWSETATSIHNY